MVTGFEVDGFWWAIFFSIVLSLVTSILSGFDKKENTKRFLNVRLNDVKGLSTDAMRSFEKDLNNLVSKYKSKLKLDIEDFKLTKRLEDRKKELLQLLERDLKSESNKSNPNYNNVYRNYKDRLNLFDNETIGSAQLIVDRYSKKKRKIF